MDTLEALLGGWGAVLSSILAIDQLRQRRRGQIKLTAEWNARTDELQIEIVNVGTRPVTVRSVELAYGEWAKDANRFLLIQSDPLRLEDGQPKEWAVSRQEIIRAHGNSGIQIGRRNLVWVRAQLAGVGQKMAPVVIDAAAIGAKGFYAPAEQNIAADLFVGFPRDQVLAQRRNLVYRSK